MIRIELHKGKIRESFDRIAKAYGHTDYDDYLQKRVAAKTGEFRYEKDPTKKAKRITTGDLGELIVCKLLKYKCVPDLRVGDSSEFNHPDIKKLGIGVKSVNAPLAHMINRNIDHPQVLITFEKDVAVVNGLFTPDILRNNLDDSLVESEGALEWKSGFNRYDLGKQFSSVEELLNILNEQRQLSF